MVDKAKARKRLEQERVRLEGVRDGIRRDQGEGSQADAAGELSSVDQHPGDLGTETFEQEKNISLLEQVEDELLQIEAAFERLDRGTYGTCQVCGRPIGRERLEALPATRFCIDDQAKAERELGSPRPGG
jgi:RNA polymerase-binding transcription factor DksA